MFISYILSAEKKFDLNKHNKEFNRYDTQRVLILLIGHSLQEVD